MRVFQLTETSPLPTRRAVTPAGASDDPPRPTRGTRTRHLGSRRRDRRERRRPRLRTGGVAKAMSWMFEHIAHFSLPFWGPADTTTRPLTTRSTATTTAMERAVGNRGKLNWAFEIGFSKRSDMSESYNFSTCFYYRSDFRRHKTSDQGTGSGFPAQRPPNQSLRASASMNNLRQDTNDGVRSRADTTTEQDFR